MIEIARSTRLFPGDGALLIEDILNVLPVVPYSLEIPNTQLRETLGDEEFAKQALIRSREFLASRQQPTSSEQKVKGS